ncbi:MAG: hypothetical protein AAF961_12215, partial [Planctomycetota bacterium]
MTRFVMGLSQNRPDAVGCVECLAGQATLGDWLPDSVPKESKDLDSSGRQPKKAIDGGHAILG